MAVWQTFGTLSRTPALNASLHVEGVDGRNYIGYAPAMYDRATYYQWMASGWAGMEPVGDAPGAAAETADAHRRLRDIATESLRYAPGNPRSWMYLAEAEAGLGQPEAALEAWGRAYDLTPQSVGRAVGRVVFLMGFVDDAEARALALAELDPGKVDADLRLLAGDVFLAGLAHRARDTLTAHGFKLSPLPEA